MPFSIRIMVDSLILDAELNDSPTSKSIIKKLPLKFGGDYWGDELYGSIGVSDDEAEDAVEVIEQPGTLGYWPVGDAFCIFWGPTPLSQGDEIRPASAINVIGLVTRGLEDLIEQRPNPLHILIEAAK